MSDSLFPNLFLNWARLVRLVCFIPFPSSTVENSVNSFSILNKCCRTPRHLSGYCLVVTGCECNRSRYLKRAVFRVQEEWHQGARLYDNFKGDRESWHPGCGEGVGVGCVCVCVGGGGVDTSPPWCEGKNTFIHMYFWGSYPTDMCVNGLVVKLVWSELSVIK